MITVTLNGNPVELEQSLSIRDLLASVDVPANYLAVEINAQVVPREQHGTHLVCDGDALEVVTLVGGG
jgi:sulfur carrier protein